VHQFEQTKFYDEPEWKCRQATIQGLVGCLKCGNPRDDGEDALIVEVKALYKRVNRNEKDEETNKPRKHCIFPMSAPFWTCFNSNLVIEPDTTWLGDLKDKPIYNEEGEACPEDEEDCSSYNKCYPGDLALTLFNEE